MTLYLAHPTSEKLPLIVDRWEPIQRPTLDGMQRVRGFRTLCPKWDIFIKLLLWRLRKLCGGGGRKIVRVKGMDGTKEIVSSRHNSTWYTETVAAYIGPAQVQDRWNSNTGGRWTPAPFPKWEDISSWQLLTKEKSVFFLWSLTGCVNHT